MNNWWRWSLVWCLVLALPLKGWAFAVMPCQMSSSAPVVLPQLSSPEASTPPCHDAIEYAGSDFASVPDEAPNVPSVGMMKACSLCMSGATVASLPPFLAWQPQVPLAYSGPIPFQPQLFVSHVPEGLDPPPRNLPA